MVYIYHFILFSVNFGYILIVLRIHFRAFYKQNMSSRHGRVNNCTHPFERVGYGSNSVGYTNRLRQSEMNIKLLIEHSLKRLVI